MKIRRDNKNRILKKGERERNKNPKYEFRYSYHGKRYSLYSNTLQGLRSKENELFKRLLNNESIGPNMTLNQVFEKWSKTKKGIQDNTLNNYNYMYKKYVFDSFGESIITKIKRSNIKEFYIYLAEEKQLKVNTIDTIQNVIYQILDYAVDDDVIRSNPATHALKELKRTEKYSSKHIKALTINEEKELLNYLKHNTIHSRWLPLITVMLRTGLRIGELAALQYSDIDFENNIINVRHTLVYFDKKQFNKPNSLYQMHKTKTISGNRHIPMINDVREALLKEMENQKEFGIKCTLSVDGYNDFVFLNRFGRPYNSGTINKALKSIVENCNEKILIRDNGKQDNLIPRFSSHQLRHSFVTRTNEAGMNDKVRQVSTGHKSLDTTNNIYTDASDDFIKKEFEKFDDFISSNNSTPSTPNHTPIINKK